MQLTIDTDEPQTLRAYARLFNAAADMQEASNDLGIDVPAGTQLPPVLPAPPIVHAAPVLVTTTVIPPSDPAITLPNAAAIFGAQAAPSVIPSVPMPPSPSLPAPPNATAPATPSGAFKIITATPNGEGLDANGLPWDARINSSGENKLNADNTWRAKRGVSPLMVQSVTAELRARASLSTPAAVVIPPPPPPAAPATAGPTFSSLMIQMNRYSLEGRYSIDRLSAAVIKCGGTGLESLDKNPPLIAAVWNTMESEVGA